MSKELTNRQKELLDFLKSEFANTGIMPSTREIQAHFGFKSQTAAMGHLRALEKKGVIQRLAGKARAVIFPESLDREEIVDIPLYGNIAAGYAQDATEQREAVVSVDVRSLGLSHSRSDKRFALKVRGESMIDAHICDGDTVILEQQEPRNGDIVAALIDGESTLKRYIVDGGRPYLKAENENYPDLIPMNEMSSQGVMVGLLRRISHATNS